MKYLIFVIVLFSSCTKHFHIEVVQPRNEIEVIEEDEVYFTNPIYEEEIDTLKYDGCIWYRIGNEGVPTVNLFNDSTKMSTAEMLILIGTFINDTLVFPEEKEIIKKEKEI